MRRRGFMWLHWITLLDLLTFMFSRIQFHLPSSKETTFLGSLKDRHTTSNLQHIRRASRPSVPLWQRLRRWRQLAPYCVTGEILSSFRAVKVLKFLKKIFHADVHSRRSSHVPLLGLWLITGHVKNTPKYDVVTWLSGHWLKARCTICTVFQTMFRCEIEGMM